MLRISKLADYATVIMNDLALQPEQVYSATEISKRVHVAVTTVSKILKLLLEAGLVTSTRGADGGYRLARSAQEITLVDIIAAIDGHPAMTECCNVSNNCVHDPVCSIRSNWRVINKIILTALQSLTLADMTKPLHWHPLMQGMSFKSQMNEVEKI